VTTKRGEATKRLEDLFLGDGGIELHPQTLGHTMRRQIHIALLTGWLMPTLAALVFFGRWLTEIVIQL
jgi:hypothetical protein